MSTPSADAASALATGPDHGRPVVPSTGVLRPLGLDEVRITGGFWGRFQELNATTIIDHAERWMERVGWIGNFDAAVEGRLPVDRHGREFSDSDVYKLMEAMAWEIGRTGNTTLEARLVALVDRIAPVQEADGYLNTMFGRPGQQPRYSDLEWGHELYCYGHLFQAAVARGRTHGRDTLVEIAVRAADHVCETFGPDGLDAVCGHPEVEVALVELGRYTGDRRYLEQARLFVERRGRGTLAQIEFGQQYFQDDVPVRDAEVLRGHAVRALYLASGAADVAVETADAELLGAVDRQLATTLARRTYITGGMGAHHEGESFGDDYELPPDRSYSETCAGVAAVMTGQRMLLATGQARHADLVERALYNVVATSPAEDGKAFFYTNTLHQRTPGTVAASDAVSPRAAASLRAPWFAVSCCPTNVARTLASLGAYVATADDDGVQLHQYAPADIRTTLPDGEVVELRVLTEYPADGHIRVEVLRGAARPWTLSLRVPAWAEGASVTAAGSSEPVTAGYARVTRAFAAGEVVQLELPVHARWSWADPRVDAARGQVAVERGPVVMCLESVDLGADVATARVRTDEPPLERDGAVLVPVVTAELDDAAWPYRHGAPNPPASESRLVPLTPYHRWANRGPSTMRVWMPVV
ncbi:glycoside hydrolase family 127 protein [Georgenia yuyongxinii]|uniref:Glycoside hydrolase family 127 protein n=1 Tax=Georgenia yuyongxinii TaxID=2589797 RepID=A0A552WYF7_9MICO|nr:beta-L-arabinofuranosidase domain-containing protein [Georgenia yuyongxinii]TRW47659.1 glycoside hydrolase family 127 protein [Georgenia yuyongxinii]